MQPLSGFRVIDVLSTDSLSALATIIGTLPELPALCYEGRRPLVQTPRTAEDWAAFTMLDRLMRERASVLPRAR